MTGLAKWILTGAWMALVCLPVTMTGFAVVRAQTPAKPVKPDAGPLAPGLPPYSAQTHSLEQFGPIDTPQNAGATLQAALIQVQKQGGGTILIPKHAAANWQPTNNTQDQFRTPAPPASAKNWRAGPGVTVVDLRGSAPHLIPPQNTGMFLRRILDIPLGQSLPHWDYFPLLRLDHAIVRGTASYREPLLEDVKAGADQRFYVPSVRGLYPGLTLSLGEKTGQPQVRIASLGYDKARYLWFFTANSPVPVARGQMLSAITRAAGIHSQTDANNENQTFDYVLWRHHYSQGDSYLVDARLRYMGDLAPAAPDGGSILYNARIESLSNVFRGRVASFDPATHELTYTEPVNADTLSSGRPIINLNPRKIIAGNNAFVRQPGGAIIGWGGVVRSTDPAWTRELVGRYFAVDEPSEYVPGSDKVRRWWLISAVKREENGENAITIVRHWWGARQVAGITTLYNGNNFTTDGKNPKMLRYIIAPGANVYDASEGIESHQINPNGSRRTLRIAPAPADGTSAQFETGDPIEQAIGPDPFRVMAFRTFMFEDIPGAYPDSVFDIANHGQIQRDSVFKIAGGPRYQPKNQPGTLRSALRWGTIVTFESTANRGVVLDADMNHAAILLQQPGAYEGEYQSLQWVTQFDKVRRHTNSIFTDNAGVLNIANARPLNLSDGGLTQVTGITQQTNVKPAANLRGLGIPVPARAMSLRVNLPRPEADAAYAVTVRTTWITNHAVTRQDAVGFTVEFDRPAPPNAKIDWLLIK